MQDFKKLTVWNLAHDFVLEIYKMTKSFPKEELYGLASQIQRAAISIPTNIVEGSSRGSNKDFNRFLQISIGSASEVEYLLLLAKDLDYIGKDTSTKLIEKAISIRKMLIALSKKLKD